jgi:hypothetical protein
MDRMPPVKDKFQLTASASGFSVFQQVSLFRREPRKGAV